MTTPDPEPNVRDFSLENLIVFGSLSVSLDRRPESIVPKLPRRELADGHCPINWGGRGVRSTLGWPDVPALFQTSPLST